MENDQLVDRQGQRDVKEWKARRSVPAISEGSTTTTASNPSPLAEGECAHLFWPHLAPLCSPDLAPPGG